MPARGIQTQLIPVQELAPGAVAAIRNAVIEALVDKASRELTLPPEKLVVRDVRPVVDLQMYSAGTTAATVEDWIFTTAGDTTTGFVTVTGDKTMGDQRYVALYGVRDKRMGIATVATAAPAALVAGPSSVSLVRLSVGGADRVIWDTKVVQGSTTEQAAFSPSPVIIPQNATFNIAYYKSQATASMIIWLVLVGLTCEPIGKTISP